MENTGISLQSIAYNKKDRSKYYLYEMILVIVLITVLSYSLSDGVIYNLIFILMIVGIGKYFQSKLITRVDLKKDENKIVFYKTLSKKILNINEVLQWRLVKTKGNQSGYLTLGLNLECMLKNNKRIIYPLPYESTGLVYKESDYHRLFIEIFGEAPLEEKYISQWKDKKNRLDYYYYGFIFYLL